MSVDYKIVKKAVDNGIDALSDEEYEQYSTFSGDVSPEVKKAIDSGIDALSDDEYAAYTNWKESPTSSAPNEGAVMLEDYVTGVDEEGFETIDYDSYYKDKQEIDGTEYGAPTPEQTGEEFEIAPNPLLPRFTAPDGGATDLLADTFSGLGRIGTAVDETGAEEIGALMGFNTDATTTPFGERFEESLGYTGEGRPRATYSEAGLNPQLDPYADFGTDLITDPISGVPFGSLMKAGAKIPGIKQGLAKAAPVVADAAAKFEGRFDPIASTIGRRLIKNPIADDLPKRIKNSRDAVGDLPKYINTEKASQFIPRATEKVMEGGIEAGAEAVLSDDASMASIMAAGALPSALAVGGKGLKDMAVSGYKGRLKLKPKDMNTRFAPQVEPMFEEGMMPTIPFVGGDRSVLDNIDKRVQGINAERAAVAAGFAERSDEAMGDLYTSYLDDAVANPARLETAMGQPLISDETVRLSDVLAENTVPANYMFDDARAELGRQVEANKLNVDEAKPILAAINREEVMMGEGFRKGVPLGVSMDMFLDADDYTDFVNPGDVAGTASRWAERGKLTRSLSNQDPSLPSARAAEIMWGSSRPYLDEMPGYQQTSQEYRKWLPIQKAMEGKIDAIGNRSMLELAGPGSAGPMELLRGPAMTGNVYNLGDLMGGSVLNKPEDLLRASINRAKMEAGKRPFRDDEEED